MTGGGPRRGRPLAAARADFLLLSRAPRIELVALALNAAVVFSGWFLLPRSMREWIFAVQGPLAFSIVLETWMLGDVISTNVVTLNRGRLLPVLHDRVACTRFLRVRTVSLAGIVGTVGAVSTMAIAVHIDRFVAGVSMAVAGYAIALYALSVAAWLGILFPYHPRPLRWRWDNRRPWWRTVRWLILRFVPYTVVAALIAVLLGALVAVATAVGGHPAGHHLSERGVLVGALVATALSPALWWAATDVAGRLAARRADVLSAYLGDPERG